jgi:hypothetical protein
MMLKSRVAITDTYRDADIPETVTIKELMAEYEPVSFPHGRIVRRLVSGIFIAKRGPFARHVIIIAPSLRSLPAATAVMASPSMKKNF